MKVLQGDDAMRETASKGQVIGKEIGRQQDSAMRVTRAEMANHAPKGATEGRGNRELPERAIQNHDQWEIESGKDARKEAKWVRCNRKSRA